MLLKLLFLPSAVSSGYSKAILPVRVFRRTLPVQFLTMSLFRNSRESRFEANPLRRVCLQCFSQSRSAASFFGPFLMVSWLVVALDWWCVCFDICGTRPCRASCLSGGSLIFASGGEPQFSALISLRQRACYP